MASSGKRCMVIGIGNPDRGDDAAGQAVAAWLDGKLPPSVEIARRDGEATSLLADLEGAATAYLVDVSRSGARIGTIRRFDVSVGPLPQDAFNVSTHALGLAEAIELARALGQLPGQCIVYAIEGRSFEMGEPLSPAVAAAVAEVGNRLRREIHGAEMPEGRTDACMKRR